MELAKRGIRCSYSTGPYNKRNETEQWIRISQGCPNKCAFCYEPVEEIVFPVPTIERNLVKIMDMNLLSKPTVMDILTKLAESRVNGRVIYYELVCGVDYRFLTPIIAKMLKVSRFKRMRLAWDFAYKEQFKIKKVIDMLLTAGYRNKDLMIFMICNWQISYEECIEKMYLCAIWRVKIADCYFDGQVSPKIEPIGWTQQQIKDFRRKVRKHNQLVNFGIDPELPRR